jgi:hypothetical protein
MSDSYYGDCANWLSGLQPRRCTYCGSPCSNPVCGNQVRAFCHDSFMVPVTCLSNGYAGCPAGQNVCQDGLPAGFYSDPPSYGDCHAY